MVDRLAPLKCPVGSRYLLDIETNGLLNCKLVDYTLIPYALKQTAVMHCIVFEDLDTGEVHSFHSGDFGKAKELYRNAGTIVGHNLLGFDLLFLRLLWGIDYKVNWNPEEFDTLDGHPVRIIDTLTLSKCLNPDRGGHSLKDWGIRLGELKGTYGEQEDAWDVFTMDMLTYCIQDVNVNCRVLDALIEEMGWEEGDTHWKASNWLPAIFLEQAIRHLTTLQEHFGFKFDVELARSAVSELNGILLGLEESVEPNLPEKDLPASRMHQFPTQPFTQAGTISASGWLHLIKLGKLVIVEEKPKEAIVYSFPEGKEEEYRELLYKGYAGKLTGPAAPKVIMKKDGTLTNNAWKYMKKLDLDIVEDVVVSYTKLYNAPSSELELEYKQALRDQEMPSQTEPMLLSNQQDIKRYLVGLGWAPTTWADRDLTHSSDKKTKLDDTKFGETIEKYIKETVGTGYETFRCDHLFENKHKVFRRTERYVRVKQEPLWETHFGKEEYDYEKWMSLPERTRKVMMWQHFINANRDRPIRVITSPKYVKNADKELCDHLTQIADRVPYAKDIVMWLTYRHRRNSIESPRGTGWLHEPRIYVDGRIPTPADTCGAATSRYLHKSVANVPRVSSLYGAIMRALFGCQKDHLQIGTDGDAIEARVQGHYILPYEGGEEEAALLLAPKPYDVHTVTAALLEVTRDDAKTIRYAISYGAQPAKIAKQQAWPLKKAKQVFKEFWDANKATAAYRGDLEREWLKHGKRWIKGIDGRKIPTRSQHSLMNASFQSCGVINMKYAAVWLAEKIEEEGMNYDPFKGAVTAGFMIQYHEHRGFTERSVSKNTSNSRKA